jgi:hypothetical protein
VHRGLRAFFVGSLLAVGASLASAQSIDFNLFLSANGNTAKIPNDESVTIVTAIDTQSSVNIMATYAGTSQATIAGPPQNWLLGSTQFAVTVPTTETFPLTLTPGQNLNFTVTYTAASSSGASATVTIPYTEPSTTGTVQSTIVLAFTGASPAFTLAYALAPNNNAVAIQSGGTIPFPATQLNTSAMATLAIVNSGTAPGEITGISGPPATSPFQLIGVPLATTQVPYTLQPGTTTATLSIGITYTPTAVEKDTAQITITFQNGITDTVNLQGSGVSSTFTYTYISGSTTANVTPGQTITFPPVTLAATGTTPNSSTVIVQVKNTGTVNGIVNSIEAPPPFTISGAPVTPPTLTPGNSESFSVTYTPTQVGTQTGELVVGNATFTLSGIGLGPQLTFSYASGGATVSLGISGTVVFPSVAVSQSEKVNFTVTNSGTTAASLSLVSTNPPFSVPALSPISLAPGNSTTFPITFTPTTVGLATQALQINNTSVSLVGAGEVPPPLPSYTFTGPSGNVSPASQQPVSLTLASSYPVDLNGVLTLTTSGDLGTDPSVQFSTGLRTVDFVIPAGSTSANFAGQGSQILLQTGTVAETVTLTPSFVTTGGVDLTPASPPTLQFSIAASAPVLESIQITDSTGTQTTASFNLVIVGYSTTRDLSTLNVTFTAATGFNFSTSQSSVDLSGAASVWFQSTTAETFGGLFQVTVPFNLTGTAPKNDTLLQSIGSLSATISNSVGTSMPLQVNVQ